MESDADRSLVIAADGESLNIEPPGGGAPLLVDDGSGGTRPPIGLFEDSFELAGTGTALEVGSTKPQVLVPEHELPGVLRLWELTPANGRLYAIEELHTDGHGMKLLELRYISG